MRAVRAEGDYGDFARAWQMEAVKLSSTFPNPRRSPIPAAPSEDEGGSVILIGWREAGHGIQGKFWKKIRGERLEGFRKLALFESVTFQRAGDHSLREVGLDLGECAGLRGEVGDSWRSGHVGRGQQGGGHDAGGIAELIEKRLDGGVGGNPARTQLAGRQRVRSRAEPCFTELRIRLREIGMPVVEDGIQGGAFAAHRARKILNGPGGLQRGGKTLERSIVEHLAVDAGADAAGGEAEEISPGALRGKERLVRQRVG